VLGFLPHAATLQRVHTLDLCANGTQVPIRLQEPDLIVERSELVSLLVRGAELAGVELVCDHRYLGMQQVGNYAEVSFHDRARDRAHRVLAQAVIGADGVASGVAHSIGAGRQPVVTVVQTRVVLPRSADAGRGKVWFVPKDTRYFYWLCPEPRGTATIGLVDELPRPVRPKLDRFVRQQGLQPGAYQAALVPLYQPTRAAAGRVGRTPVLLVGDAGGQVKVTTVGGTVSGLQGAAAAARAILSRRGYQRELWPLQLELTVHWAIRRLWSRFGEEEYSALVGSMRGRLRTVLEARNRDRWAGAMMPALAAQPALLALAAKSAARW
jgi:flavin-dependent dehydrogenase